MKILLHTANQTKVCSFQNKATTKSQQNQNKTATKSKQKRNKNTTKQQQNQNFGNKIMILLRFYKKINVFKK